MTSVLRGDPALRYQQTLIAEQFRQALYAHDRIKGLIAERDAIQAKINTDTGIRNNALTVIKDLRFSTDEAFKVLCETNSRFSKEGAAGEFSLFAKRFEAEACDSCRHATSKARAGGQKGAIANCPQHASE